jgi:hypothetical protein
LFRSGAGFVSLRMYQNLGQLWEGWTKNVFVGLDRSILATLLFVCAIFLMFVFPDLMFIFLLAKINNSTYSTELWLSVFVLVSTFQNAAIRDKMSQHMSFAGNKFSLNSMGGILVMGILLDSARRVITKKGWTWKGRSLG